MKQYYKLIDPSLNSPVVTYWCGDNSKASTLLHLRGFVMPLGTKKPNNVSRETIYTF